MFGNGDDFVEKRFSALQYLTSVEGILRLLSIVLILLSSSLHCFYSSCGDVPLWYPYLLPVGSGVCGLISLLFYLFYITGFAGSHFPRWNAMDIILSTLCIVILLAVSVLTLVNCNDPHPNPVEFIFSSLSLIAAICNAIIATVSLVKYRIDIDPVLEENNNEIPQNVKGISAAQYRKSVAWF